MDWHYHRVLIALTLLTAFTAWESSFAENPYSNPDQDLSDKEYVILDVEDFQQALEKDAKNIIAEQKLPDHHPQLHPDIVKDILTLAWMSYTRTRTIENLEIYKRAGWIFYFFQGTSGNSDIGYTGEHTSGFIAFRQNTQLDAQKPYDLVVAFHGTESVEDALTDIDFRKVSAAEIGLKGSVHRGFLKAATSSIDEINDKIINLLDIHEIDYENVNFILTGHSLGGALANISAAALAFKWGWMSDNEAIENVFVVTMGAPRVFDKTAANHFERKFGMENSLRFVAYPDIVSSVPYGWMGFKHTGIYIEVPILMQINAERSSDIAWQFFDPKESLVINLHSSDSYYQKAYIIYKFFYGGMKIPELRQCFQRFRQLKWWQTCLLYNENSN